MTEQARQIIQEARSRIGPYGRPVKEMCGNSNTKGTGIGGIRQCGGSAATHEVTVRYGKTFSGGHDQDSHRLCKDCGNNLKRDAEGHGYDVIHKKL